MAIEEWDDTASNQQQQYLTHGVFRYFGKLPPTVTGRILDELDIGVESFVVDVMCGSGTTLLEAALRGAKVVGVDCNDLSALIARVKTTPVPREEIDGLLNGFSQRFEAQVGQKYLDETVRDSKLADAPRAEVIPQIRNFEHWFSRESASLMAAVRDWVEELEAGAARDLAWVAFASSIRSCSRASIRTGRLFRDADKRLPNPVADFAKRLAKLGDAVSTLVGVSLLTRNSVEVVVADARNTNLKASQADLVFCHPPYFGLYKYSSDVLRFEMEWLGLSRKSASRREIVDGFKTTDETLVEKYVSDLVAVAREARRLAKPGGALVFVTADSTLRKERLQVISPLIQGTEGEGWRLMKHARRKVRFAQASYHKSADEEIVRPDDEVLIFRAV